MANKYNARKEEIDGFVFDSRKEANRYRQLKGLEDRGIINRLQLQVPFELLPKQETRAGKNYRAVKYIADFMYEDVDGNKYVEDVKGYRYGQAYSVFKIKQKLMKYMYDIEVIEV